MQPAAFNRHDGVGSSLIRNLVAPLGDGFSGEKFRTPVDAVARELFRMLWEFPGKNASLPPDIAGRVRLPLQCEVNVAVT